MTRSMVGSFAAVIFFAGCGADQSPQPPPNAAQPAPLSSKAPFKYRIIKQDDSPDGVEPRVFLLVETPLNVAKKATTEDLQQLWRHIEPTIADDCRVLIKLATDVPGTSLWGNITRLNRAGVWEVTAEKFKGEIEEVPYYFVDKIDRTKPNQGMMILTLPLANQIVERLKRSGWTQSYRSEDLVKLEQRATGMGSFDVTLSPEGITLQAWDKDDSAIFDAIELLTEEIGIGDAIKLKMQTVVGSPEYFRGTSNGVATWYWTIGVYEVSYLHKEPGIDDIDIGHAE